jgi:glucose-1-phosphate adenylyltransferase
MMSESARFISRLTHNSLALILAGGRGSRLEMLTDWRTKPAVPFGGKFRIIDFSLSNCLNSDVRRICVLTQYKSHSLTQHILQGWNRLNEGHGEFIDIIPAQQWVDENMWYRGTADAVYQALDIIESYKSEHVLILAGDHIYNMDYGEMLAHHVETGADFTIACNTIARDEAASFGVMHVDQSMRIVDFKEKPEDPEPMPDNPDLSLVSMGIYVISLDYLRQQLIRDAADESSSHDFGNDVIPYALNQGHHLQAYQFHNPTGGDAHYWRDVGTIDAYYQANMEIISATPPLDIYDPDWPVLTYQPQLPPAHFIGNDRACTLKSSMASGGCVIDQSALYNSILFSNVKVGCGCALENVIALPGCEIGSGSQLKNVLLDNQCRVPKDTVIGENPDEDGKRFHVTDNGIVVVNREMLGQSSRYMPGVVQ